MLVTNPSPNYNRNSIQSISKKYTRYGLPLVVDYVQTYTQLENMESGFGYKSLEIYVCMFRFGLDIYQVGFESSSGAQPDVISTSISTKPRLFGKKDKTIAGDLLVKHYYYRFNAGNLLEELNMFLGEFVA